MPHDRDTVRHRQQLSIFGADEQNALAGRGQLVDQPVDRDLRADVDALSGLVEDENIRARVEPARNQKLLLVAAR